MKRSRALDAFERQRRYTRHLALFLLPAAFALPHCSQAREEKTGTGRQNLSEFQPGLYTIGDSQHFMIDGGFYHWSGTTNAELFAAGPGNTYQQWQFSTSGSGFTICNVGAGACLSDGGTALEIGVATDVWTVAASGGGYTLQNQRTGAYVTDAASPANEATVSVSSTPSGWNLAGGGGASSFQAGTYTIYDSQSFAIDGGFYHWNGPCPEELYSLSASNTYQQWQFVASGSGFTICNVGAGASACLSDGGAALDVGVGTDVWVVAPSGSGYTVQNQGTGRYITDPGSPADGATILVSSTASVWALDSGSGSGAGGPDGGSSGDAGTPSPVDSGSSGPVPITPVTSGAQIVHPGDDIASIVPACSTGVVHFSAGTYALNTSMHVPPNCQLEGDPNWASVITGGVGDMNTPIFQLDHSSNVTITRLNFQNINSQAISNYGGYGTGNIEYTHIYLNLFEHFAATAIVFFDPSNMTIERNAFNDFVVDSVHLFSNSPGGGVTPSIASNVVVQWNFGANQGGDGVNGVGGGGAFLEIQLGTSGLHVYQNVYYSQQQWEGMALSIASAGAACTGYANGQYTGCVPPDNGVNGVFIDGNILLDNGIGTLTSGGDPWTAIEVMGATPLVQNNYIRGWAGDAMYAWPDQYVSSSNSYVGGGPIDFLNNSGCGSVGTSSVSQMLVSEGFGSLADVVYTGSTYSTTCANMAPPALYPQLVAPPDLLDDSGGLEALTNSVIPGPGTYWPNINANLNSAFP